MSALQQRLAAGLAAAAGSVGGAYFVLAPAVASDPARAKVTLDETHQIWLEQHRPPDAANLGPVLVRCILEAKKADPDHVFGVARCVGAKKKKVELDLTIDHVSMQWLRDMREQYEIADISKTCRIVVDYNMQEVKKFPGPKQSSADVCSCGAHGSK